VWRSFVASRVGQVTAGMTGADAGWVVTIPLVGPLGEHGGAVSMLLDAGEHASLRELGVESVIVAGRDVVRVTVTLERDAAVVGDAAGAVALASEVVRRVALWRRWPPGPRPAGAVEATWCADTGEGR